MKTLRTVFLITLLTISSIIAFTDNSYSLGKFREGVVTKKVWKENGQYRIRIDNVKYMIMPGVMIVRPREDSDSFQAKKTADELKSLKKGMSISFKSFGHNINQIEIMP